MATYRIVQSGQGAPIAGWTIEVTAAGEQPHVRGPYPTQADAQAEIDRLTAINPPPPPTTEMPKEIGGPKGPEPTRYGDWEVNGRCTDF